MLFRRQKPVGGRWSLAHPLREPLRATGQSLILWPAAALAAIMMAAPQDGVAKPALLLLFLQITVVYPIIAGAAVALYVALQRIGMAAWSPLPLAVPLLIVALWMITLSLFITRYVASVLGLA